MWRERLDVGCERGIHVLSVVLLVFGPLALGGTHAEFFAVMAGLGVGALLLWLGRIDDARKQLQLAVDSGRQGQAVVTAAATLLAELAKSLGSAGAAGDGMHLLVGWTARYELRKEGNSAGQPQLLFFDTSGKRYELPQSPP